MLFLLLAPDDDAVISELFLENYHRLRRAAAAILRDSAAAEDAVQDAFVNCIRHVGTLRSLPPPAQITYLVTAAKRSALNAARKNGAVFPVPPEDLEPADASASAEDAAIVRLTAAEVKTAVQRLPESLRDVLRFKYLLELSDGEIARTLGVAKSTVRVYLMRARNAVLALCKEDGHAEKQV
ncbi:MAG: sigma-70 family RNA polymerase sigma factor [Clostridia bacterium]|nr:sigma-70 family RNA polymerase sigma factor [Clostridia bacterium]